MEPPLLRASKFRHDDSLRCLAGSSRGIPGVSKVQSAENWLECVGLYSGPRGGTVQNNQHAAVAELKKHYVEIVSKACLIPSMRYTRMQAMHMHDGQWRPKA